MSFLFGGGALFRRGLLGYQPIIILAAPEASSAEEEQASAEERSAGRGNTEEESPFALARVVFDIFSVSCL